MTGSATIKGLLLEKDIKASYRSRLRAKVLVFKDRRSMLQSFYRTNGYRQPKNAAAVVDYLQYKVIDVSASGRRVDRIVMEDARYFCLMWFCLEHMNQEVVTHESVHAAFAYAARVGTRHVGWIDDDSDVKLDEAICYPAGYIANEVSKIALSLRS